MSTMTVKDGLGVSKLIQIESGSEGIVTAHVIASTSTNSDIQTYYPNGPSNNWNWSSNNGTVEIFTDDLTRKSIIIYNSGSIGSVYLLVGNGVGVGTNNGFGTISDVTKPPPIYSFILEPGSTYFSDIYSAGLRHAMYVPSSSLLINSSSMYVTVTEIS